MTLRHLRIFLSICENDYNVTRAAESLFMTQPAASLAIKELEEGYGIVLFDRIGRRLQITEAGKEFRDYASNIISMFDHMEKSMKNMDKLGLLRVGASSTIGSQFLPSYVKAFYNRFPGTKIKAYVEPMNLLEEKLLDNKIDFALIEGITHIPNLVCEPYMEDRLTVICPAVNSFQFGQSIDIEEFRRQKFLLREHGSGTREIFDQVIEQAGISVEPIWESVSTTALINAVINGLGISVLPHRMIIPPMQRGLVNAITVNGLTFQRNFCIIYHKDKFLTTSARNFIQLCRDYELDYPLPSYNSLY